MNEISEPLLKPYGMLSEKYRVLKHIARGGFADVLLVRDVITYESKAIKTMKLTDSETENCENVDKLREEVKNMSTLNHPNILRYYECFQYRNFSCIVSEYCEENLATVLKRYSKKKTCPTHELMIEWFYNLSQALNYLHSIKIVHKHIKPSNILFKHGQIKIADYDISRETIQKISKNSNQALQYMSPELINCEKISSKTDVWSLGCVFYEIFYLQQAFNGNNQQELKENILNRETEKPIFCRCDTENLIDKMLCVEQFFRCGMTNVLLHPLFKELRLIDLCRKDGNYKEIYRLICDEYADVNYKNLEGRTALMEASKYGHEDVVKLLIDRKALVNGFDNDGSTPLMEASEKGHKDVVKLLIQNEAIVNQKDKSGWTTLMKASKHGYRDTVKLLIENRATVNEPDQNGVTAIIEASCSGHKDVVELLIQNKASVSQKGDHGTALMLDYRLMYLASLKGHIEVVELLIRNKAIVNEKRNEDGWTALMCASRNGHKDVVELLIKNRVKVNETNKTGETALAIASKQGFTDVVEYLKLNGAITIK